MGKRLTKEMLEVVAKSFFEDSQYDDDYPHKTWEEQFAEFEGGLECGHVSEDFLLTCYEFNKPSFN